MLEKDQKEESGVETLTDLNYIQTDFNVAYKFGSFEATAGPYASFLVGGKQKVGDEEYQCHHLAKYLLKI